jgi:hypothetical protein
MKKITEQVVGAFLRGENKKVRNTESRDGILYLFGNEIAQKYSDGLLAIANAGWFSNTTKERLNAIPGVSILQKKGEWFLNGLPWNGQRIVVNRV